MEHKLIMENWRRFTEASSSEQQELLEEGVKELALAAGLALSALAPGSAGATGRLSPMANAFTSAAEVSTRPSDELVVDLIGNLKGFLDAVEMGDFKNRLAPEEMAPLRTAAEKARKEIKAVTFRGELKRDYSAPRTKDASGKVKVPFKQIPKTALPAFADAIAEVWTVMLQNPDKFPKALEFAKTEKAAMKKFLSGKAKPTDFIYGDTM